MNLNLSYFDYQIDIFFNHKEKFIIVPKGRRSGITKGAANSFIEFGLENISPLLWVDVINGNIDRYFDRYFYPELKQLDESLWNFNRQKRELKISESIIDFRSADHPEAIEGFGYKKIFLNEAGIILKDPYLYGNAILPLLLDYPESQLIAAGVPKGKSLKNGNKHKFFELYENCFVDKNYKLIELTSYRNPLIKDIEIDLISSNMTASEREQEIMGQFIDMTGQNPFAHQYDPSKHESELAVFNPTRQLYISIDFNLNPFGVIFFQIWRDKEGEHFHIVDEASIKHGSIPAMIDLIKSKYGENLANCMITGDAMGRRGDLSQRDNANYYQQIQRGLRLREGQIRVPANPTHENSRADVNYVLHNFPDFKINPKKCPNTCRDMRNVQVDAFGSIIKRDRNDLNQQSDFLDCGRYAISTFLKKWISDNMKRVRK